MNKKIQGHVSGVWFIRNENSNVVFVVESIANALALGAIGYNAACIFSSTNTKNIPIIKEIFPDKRIILWLDRSDTGKIEEIQKKAIEKYEVEGIFWEESRRNRYDVNDLLIETKGKFPETVQAYLASLQKVTIDTTDRPPTTQAKTIAGTLGLPKKHIILEAATGSGKTYECAVYFAQCIAQGIPVVYVAANRTDQQAFCELLLKITGSTMRKLRTKILRGGEKAVEDEQSEETPMEIGTIGKNILGIITHKTYLRRKGLSMIYYSLLEWIKKSTPILLVDEADSYCDSLTTLMEIGSRYRKIQRKGASEAAYPRMDSCQAFSGCGNCSNCFFAHHQELHVNSHHIPEIRTHSWVKESAWKQEVKLDLPEIPKVKDIWLDNMHVELLEQHSINMLAKEYRYKLKENERYHEKEIIEDMIDTAYCPNVYTVFPTLEGKPLDPKSPNFKEVILQNISKVKFPAQPCGVQYLSLKDTSVLLWLARYCRATRWLSATFSPSNLQFLEEKLSLESEKVEVKTPGYQVDQLLILGLPKKPEFVKISKDTMQPIVFTKGLDEHGKVIVFETKKSRSALLFSKMPENYPAACFLKDDILINEKFTDEEYKTLFTHSRGNLGRSMSLPEYNTNIVNAKIYKPKIAFDLREYTKEELIKRMEEDRISLLIQNLGRIIRLTQDQRDGTDKAAIRKVFIIYDCPDKNDLEKVRQAFQAMVKTKIEIAWYEHDQAALQKDAIHFLETGKVEFTEKTLLEKAKEGGLRSITKTKREEIDKDEIQKERERARLEEFKQNAISWLGTWREFVRKYHIDRLTETGKITEDFSKVLENIIVKKEKRK